MVGIYHLGLTANIMIIREEFNGSLNQYNNAQLQEFVNIKATILSVSINDNKSLIYKYKNMVDGVSWCYLTKVIKRENLVYLVSGTSSEEDWPHFEERIIKSIESFKFNDASAE